MKLVLLPGLDGTGRLFEPLQRALPPQLTSAVISYPNDQQLSYAELVRFTATQLPLAEDYALLAESFSGPVAIEIAAEQPGNLKALLLSTTFLTNPMLVPRIASYLLHGPAFMFGPPQFAVSRYLLGKNPPVHLVETFRQASRSVRPDVIASRIRSVLSVDVRQAFAACRLPILYLRGTEDRLVKPGSLTQMQKIKPEMSVAEIDGPHLLLQREPAKSSEAITHYLDSVL